jgi:hypothetical protein
MTPEEITRRNVAIATYMGTITKYNPDTGLWEHCDGDDLEAACLEYHSDWRWLMSVVEKMIDEQSSDCVLSGPGYSSSIDDGFLADFFSDKRAQFQSQGKGKTLIMAVFIAVSDWIIEHGKTANGGEPQPQLEGREGE